MRILFLTSRFPSSKDHFTLEKELVYAFANDGHQCTIANILEKKYGKHTYLESITINEKHKIELLNIKTGNLFNDVSFLEKKITVLSLPYVIPKAIKKTFSKRKFDCIIAYGPYLCSAKIISLLKSFFGCDAILMQWDIFPQNAFDLGIIKNKLLLNIFVNQQKKQLEQYKLILCNSVGNIEYLADKFPRQTNSKLSLFYNCESPAVMQDLSPVDKHIIREKFNLDPSAVILIFGGNIGIPQALENIIKIADLLSCNKAIHFVISGQGTEAAKIKNQCKAKHNITFIDFLPSKDYEQLLTACDYGLISLSPLFTVPNFPAKVTSYLKLGIPIFACLDQAAMQDLGHFIIQNNIGFSVPANNYEEYIQDIENFLLNKDLHAIQRQQAKEVFNQYFNIHESYPKLIKELAPIIQVTSDEPA